jgi:response regulator RpfG family c-di-GMP phosphodiesterase
MPEMDGFEATRAIRASEGPGRHVPILAMTARAQKGDRETCIEAGMDDYISKPVDPRHLADTVARWAGSTVLRDGRERQVPIPPKSAPPPVDMDRIQSLAGDETDFAQELATAFSNDVATHLDAMNRALIQGDTKRVRTEAHAIKGAAGNLGAHSLADSMKTIESIADLGVITSVAPILENARNQFHEAREFLKKSGLL